MPKMQKSDSADNSQGQALSYVLGVYFGDGCVDVAWRNKDGTERKRFRLRAIDEDFVAFTSEQLKRAFNVEPTHGVDNSKRFGKKTLHSVTVSQDGIGEYIQSICGKRTIIPNIVYSSEENKRAFIEGFLDSEGWVVIIAQELGRFYLQIGVGATTEMIYEIAKLMTELGIKVGKIKTKRYPSGKILKSTLFNIESFLASGLRFNASRKQRKIDGYLQARQALKDSGLYKPNGASFNDYKRTFRETVRSGFQAKE